MNIMKFYHYTDNFYTDINNWGNLHEIHINGCNLYALNNQEAGFLGWGIQLKKKMPLLEKIWNRTIMEMEVDVSSFACIFNPYFFDKTAPDVQNIESEKLFHCIIKDHNGQKLNTNQDNREIHCKAIRDEFLSAGYKGIYTQYDGFGTVVFDVSAIKTVTPLNLSRCDDLT